ncbi:MAG: hypothetical protein N2C14_23865 [Planctomycetales bacterium]
MFRSSGLWEIVAPLASRMQTAYDDLGEINKADWRAGAGGSGLRRGG